MASAAADNAGLGGSATVFSGFEVQVSATISATIRATIVLTGGAFGATVSDAFFVLARSTFRHVRSCPDVLRKRFGQEPSVATRAEPWPRIGVATRWCLTHKVPTYTCGPRLALLYLGGMAGIFNEDALDRWVKEAGRYNSDRPLRNVVYEVNASHAGQPRTLVDAHLRQRFSELGLAVKQPVFDEIVTAISEDSLRRHD
jgi:hypothetical protein